MPTNFLVLLGLGLALVGCGGQRIDQHGDYTILVHGRSFPPQGGLDAIVTGTLAARGGCVGLENEESDTWYPVVWPVGTVFRSSDPLFLRLSSGVEVGLGDVVTGGGGYLKPEHLKVTIPEECDPGSRDVAVFNPGDRPVKG